MIRRISIALAGVALGGAFYMLLVDTRYSPELYFMAGVAGLTGLVFEAAREQGFAPARLSLASLAGAWRPLAGVPKHVALLCRDAVAQLFTRSPSRGAFRSVRYEVESGPRGRANIALSESLGSFAPNTIVLGVDPDTGLLLVHQLHRDGGAEKVDVLRLG